MQNYSKIAELLRKSTLSLEQADELLVLFGRSDDRELFAVVEVLEQDIAWAGKIYQNYAAKKTALEKADEPQWQKIFNAEVELLREVK